MGGGLTDGFVLRLSADGSTLLFSTFLGGSTNDNAEAIAVDATGAVYVTGWTSMGSPTNGVVPFPITAGSAFRTAGPSMGFLTKLNPSGAQFVFSAYLGNVFASDSGGDVTTDANGDVYVAAYSEQSSVVNENNIGSTVSVPGIGVLKFSADGAMLLDSNFVAFSAEANRTGFWFQKRWSLRYGSAIRSIPSRRRRSTSWDRKASLGPRLAIATASMVREVRSMRRSRKWI